MAQSPVLLARGNPRARRPPKAVGFHRQKCRHAFEDRYTTTVGNPARQFFGGTYLREGFINVISGTVSSGQTYISDTVACGGTLDNRISQCFCIPFNWHGEILKV